MEHGGATAVLPLAPSANAPRPPESSNCVNKGAPVTPVVNSAGFGFNSFSLAEVSAEQTLKRQILIQIRPVQSKR